MGEVLGNQVSASAAVRQAWQEKLAAAIRELNIECDARTPERIARYHELLADWNTRMNLTGDTDFDTSVDRHYTDSLAPLVNRELFPKGASLIDVGSGAGFPGLPLAIARPDLKVTLLDSLMKRINFLDAVVTDLGLTNVTLVHSRAEDGGRDVKLRESFDLAVARAVAPLPVLSELLLPFVKVGGRMICYKGPSAEEELTAGQKAAHMLGGAAVEHVPVVLPRQPEWQHCLLTCEKKVKTVRQYPRKAGTPGRSPLGTSAQKAE